jgi:hypothetical protein
MRCEYNDGLAINYSGSLTVRKGNEINGYLAKEDNIPDSFRKELDKAASSGNCGELRKIAMSVATDCARVCIK